MTILLVPAEDGGYEYPLVLELPEGMGWNEAEEKVEQVLASWRATSDDHDLEDLDALLMESGLRQANWARSSLTW